MNFVKEKPFDSFSVFAAAVLAVDFIDSGAPKLKDGFVLVVVVLFVVEPPKVKDGGVGLLSVSLAGGLVKENEVLEPGGSLAASDLPNENNGFGCEVFEDANAKEGFLGSETTDESI